MVKKYERYVTSKLVMLLSVARSLTAKTTK